MSNRLEDLDPEFAPWARWLISLWPYGQLTSTRRTFHEQLQLYRAYLRGEARYPAAPPGSSQHEIGWAFDYVAPNGVLAALGEIWQSYGGVWGGPDEDPIHFGV